MSETEKVRCLVGGHPPDCDGGKNRAPAVHIPVEHQSAPKEHWCDKEIAKAAEEIRTGQFTPVPDDADFLSLGLQRGLGIKNPATMTPEEKTEAIKQTEDSLALAQHPRVQEALARLEQEKRDARTTQEALEKTQMLFELNAASMKRNQWDGQSRWFGKENEEMRVVNIMTPQQILERLEGAIGEGRVFLNRFAVKGRVALLAPGEKSLIISAQSKADNGMYQVGTLQYPCGPEWMVMRFDEYGVPTTAKYLGWRTALLSMIQLGVITEKEAQKAFPLKLGPAGDWYRQQLFEFRTQRGMVA